LVVDDRQRGLLGGEGAEDIAGAVAGAVVDEDDLLGQRDGLDTAEDLADRVPLVVDRDDDRQEKVIGDAVDAELAAERLTQEAAHALLSLGFLQSRHRCAKVVDQRTQGGKWLIAGLDHADTSIVDETRSSLTRCGPSQLLDAPTLG